MSTHVLGAPTLSELEFLTGQVLARMFPCGELQTYVTQQSLEYGIPSVLVGLESLWRDEVWLPRDQTISYCSSNGLAEFVRTPGLVSTALTLCLHVEGGAAGNLQFQVVLDLSEVLVVVT